MLTRAALLPLLLPIACASRAARYDVETPAYPEARRAPVAEEMHGVLVADPYRWMEELDADDTQAWMKAQDALLREHLAPVPGAEALAERIAAISSFEGRSTPNVKGVHTFATRTAAGASTPTLLVTTGGEAPRVLFDPKKFEGSGGAWRGSYSASPTGRWVAIELDPGPSQHNNMRVLEVATGRFLDDEVRSTWGAASWTHDESGFFYMRFPDREPGDLSSEMGRPTVHHHTLRTAQEADTLVFELADRPEWLLRKQVSRDGRYLIVKGEHGSSFSGMDDQVWVRDLSDPTATLTPLFAEGSGKFAYEGNAGSTFWFRTTVGAPNGRLVALELSQPGPEHWVELVAEAPDQLQSVSEFPEHFALRYTHDVVPLVKVVGHDGKLAYVLDPPGGGQVGGFGDNIDEPVAYFSLGALYDPGSVYRLNVETGDAELWWRPELAHDPDDFETRQVFYRSADGTRVPMFVVGKKGFRTGENRPVFMYGYGALGWSAFPWYQPHVVAWLERGGLYALPGVRGGGEYGDTWKRAGERRNKQVCIDDYNAAAEFLIAEGYTSAARLVAHGGSASGVLAAAAAMQRPDLYGAALIDTPKLDMLRYHHFTGSAYTIPAFGTADDAEDFAVLRSYSPYHNVDAEQAYPPMLVMVGEHDATAPPFHGYKFVAEMQARATAAAPCLIQVMWGAGHNHGDTIEQRSNGWADALRFLFRALKWTKAEG